MPVLQAPCPAPIREVPAPSGSRSASSRPNSCTAGGLGTRVPDADLVLFFLDLRDEQDRGDHVIRRAWLPRSWVEACQSVGREPAGPPGRTHGDDAEVPWRPARARPGLLDRARVVGCRRLDCGRLDHGRLDRRCSLGRGGLGHRLSGLPAPARRARRRGARGRGGARARPRARPGSAGAAARAAAAAAVPGSASAPCPGRGASARLPRSWRLGSVALAAVTATAADAPTAVALVGFAATLGAVLGLHRLGVDDHAAAVAVLAGLAERPRAGPGRPACGSSGPGRAR